MTLPSIVPTVRLRLLIGVRGVDRLFQIERRFTDVDQLFIIERVLQAVIRRNENVLITARQRADQADEAGCSGRYRMLSNDQQLAWVSSRSGSTRSAPFVRTPNLAMIPRISSAMKRMNIHVLLAAGEQHAASSLAWQRRPGTYSCGKRAS